MRRDKPDPNHPFQEAAKTAADEDRYT